MKHSLLSLLALALAFAPLSASAKTADGKQKLVLVAGKPSHGPREHEYNAGMLLLAKCLAQGAPALKVDVVTNGWPQDESVFNDADAVVFFMDGGAKHEAAKPDHLAKTDELSKHGVGIGALHYGVEVVADQTGERFRHWIGGHYESMYSVNPMWEPNFTNFPVHPITRGVKPFQIKDEWYFNMRFMEGFTADGATEKEGTKFVPILVARPADQVRNGPYSAPKGPYPHIQAATGRPEAMMWCVERPDGGRGFGFTGAHYHDNWGNENFRKVVLNALVWVAKGEVPANGVESHITPEDLDANLDPKPPKKPAPAPAATPAAAPAPAPTKAN